MSARRRNALLVSAMPALLFVSVPAHANMGPAMLIFDVVALAVIEAVIVVLEAPLLKYRLGLSNRRALTAALAGNAGSTILGLSVAVIASSPPGGALGADATPLSVTNFILTSVLGFYVLSFIVEWPIVRAVTQSSWKRTASAVAIANVPTHLAMLALWMGPCRV